MRLHSECRGAGPDIVLLHGWAMNLRVFDAFAAELAATHRVTAIDLPGHGRSPWRAGLTPEEQADWLLEQMPQRGALLGWSLGGQLALRMAARAPERVSRLILVASTPRFVASADWPHGLEAAVLQRFAAGLSQDPARIVDAFLELQVRGGHSATAVLAQLRQALEQHGEATDAALAAGLEQLATTDLRELAGALALPVLLFGGQNDRVTPPAALRALAAQLRAARLVELRRAAHAPFLSHRAELLRELRTFLAAGESSGVAA
jgi:pimeloyl-[acyl-carrier protein] methyl ester esterase